MSECYNSQSHPNGNLRKLLKEQIAKSKQQAIDDEYIAYTEEALAKEIFGFPSLIVENKIFWGEDRLEDATVYVRKGVK